MYRHKRIMSIVFPLLKYTTIMQVKMRGIFDAYLYNHVEYMHGEQCSPYSVTKYDDKVKVYSGMS